MKSTKIAGDAGAETRVVILESGEEAFAALVREAVAAGISPEDAVVLTRTPLHAVSLRIPHPSGKGWLQVESPLPDDLSTAEIVAKVEAVVRKYGKPVLLTEAGFPSAAGANIPRGEMTSGFRARAAAHPAWAFGISQSPWSWITSVVRAVS